MLLIKALKEKAYSKSLVFLRLISINKPSVFPVNVCFVISLLGIFSFTKIITPVDRVDLGIVPVGY